MKVSASFESALRDATVVAPELPQADAYETLERIIELERRITGGQHPSSLSSADYIEGSAQFDDQINVYGERRNGVLVSADHATAPYNSKQGAYRGADHGTGGLAALLSQTTNTVSILPAGRQTANIATSSDGHPVKHEMNRLLPDQLGFVSLHGMASGKLLRQTDETEIHALVGLGLNPNDQSRQAAERIVGWGADLGLRVRIGNDTPYVTYDPATRTLLKKPGSEEPLQAKLMAKGPKMTTNYAYGIMERIGRPMPSVQMELTRLLRLIPSDFHDGWHKDRKALAMGVHLGYLLMKSVVTEIEDA